MPSPNGHDSDLREVPAVQEYIERIIDVLRRGDAY